VRNLDKEERDLKKGDTIEVFSTKGVKGLKRKNP